jgi:hypothetical protein
MGDQVKTSDRDNRPYPAKSLGALLLLASGLLAGALAAGATMAIAATARAAGVSLEITGTDVPLSAFPFWTLVGALSGVVLAAVLRRRRRFIRTTVVATGLSLIPPVLAADDAATALVLVATHLVAAAIVIPALSLRLTDPGPAPSAADADQTRGPNGVALTP